MRFGLILALVLLLAPSARAEGETFQVKWVTSYHCEGDFPEPQVRRWGLRIVSDGEWLLQRSLPCPPIVCAGVETIAIRGELVRHSARRAVFVGIADGGLFDGPATLEADLALDRDGEVSAIRGKFIRPAEAGMCASRGKFRTTKRTD